mmetsp:Transcript_604/g.1631  ORF Transcript_604/g.1631 Transcript_604/m.1631 type:complete len:108 (-) Transcript_604:695-1018(-)
MEKLVRGVEPPGVLDPFRCLLAFCAKDSKLGTGTLGTLGTLGINPGDTKLVIGKNKPGGGVKPPEPPDGGLAKEAACDPRVEPGVRTRDVVTGVVEREECEGCRTTA